MKLQYLVGSLLQNVFIDEETKRRTLTDSKLCSFPYIINIIRDSYLNSKETNEALVTEHLLVCLLFFSLNLNEV